MYSPFSRAVKKKDDICIGSNLAKCISYMDDQAPGHHSVDTAVKTGQLNIPGLVRVHGIGTAKSSGNSHQRGW